MAAVPDNQSGRRLVYKRRELGGAMSTARVKMWRAMRMMGADESFSVGELIALAAAPRKSAEKFLPPLVRAGYLRAVGEGQARRYVLIRDTGPVPPRVNAAGVALDANIEIERERSRHAVLLAEIRRTEDRLHRLGAYVERFKAQKE